MRSTHTHAAILSQARGSVSIESVYIGDPGPGEVLLRMEACGLCHSDLFVCGLERLPLAPVTLGHEGIGRVEAVGAEVSGWAAGDRAGMTFLGTTCGVCEWCTSGRQRFCPKQTNFGYTLHGALTEYAIVPAAALVRVPAALPSSQAAPLCCAGWTAYGALREAALSHGQAVGIFGLGGLGHLALQMAHARGLRIAAVDLAEEKLEMARAAGAEIAIRADEAARPIQREFGGLDAALVFTASPAAIPQAFRSLKRNGKLVLVGLAVAQYELPLVDTILKGISVCGNYLGSSQDLEDVFALASAGDIRAEVQTHSLAEVPAVLQQLKNGEVMGRAVVTW